MLSMAMDARMRMILNKANVIGVGIVTMNEQFYAADEAMMLKFGGLLLLAMQQQGVVFLKGDLGLGKTTISRGVITGAGHTGAVKSPTYTLVEPYDFTGFSVYHFDLYRLSEPEELEYLGIRDYFSDNMLSLIEWPQMGAGFLPKADLEITLSLKNEGRLLSCQSNTEQGNLALTYLSDHYLKHP
jgi:tRNA threonylcarbamoyladenosine biosynthesis protein TsaE